MSRIKPYLESLRDDYGWTMRQMEGLLEDIFRTASEPYKEDIPAMIHILAGLRHFRDSL